MPETITPRITSPATERLARAALDLHRLALAAAEIRHLPSPTARREQTSKRGAQDPTATTALDDRRAAVADALDDVNEAVTLLMVGEEFGWLFATLTTALNRWDDR